MGLPIWRDPDEQNSQRDAVKADPTAAARSSIRRSSSVHWRRGARPRLTRDSTVLPPRLAPPPIPPSLLLSSDGGRNASRTLVPPISTLLESADRHAAFTPPLPVPDARNHHSSSASFGSHEESADHQPHDISRLLPSNSAELARLDTELREARRAASRRAQLRFRRTRETVRSTHPAESVQAAFGYYSQEDGPLRTSTLPTPPWETREEEANRLRLAEARVRTDHVAHPLRHSWTPDSPVDGLGDRNRSPTPGDGWEIMRNTITPDATLPSADSSFASAAASQSFASASTTEVTEPEAASSTSRSPRSNSEPSEYDSVSSIDPDDLSCLDDESADPNVIAVHMYDDEMRSSEGRQRIRMIEEFLQRNDEHFVPDHRSTRIEVGLHLIEAALESENGRARLAQIGIFAETEDERDARQIGSIQRRDLQNRRSHRLRAWRVVGEERETESRRARSIDTSSAHGRSPPPRYDSLDIGITPAVETSHDEPQPQPVSPPNHRFEDAVRQADLEAMRGIVERLARRNDVSEEWWQSIGLNLSRTRPRAISPHDHEGEGLAASEVRVTNGRIERRDSRL